MKASELREKSTSELEKKLLELLKEQLQLRMQKGMGEMPKPHLFKQIRRNIALLKTLLREKGEAV